LFTQILLTGNRRFIDLNHTSENLAGHSVPGMLRYDRAQKYAAFGDQSLLRGFLEATGIFPDADYIDRNHAREFARAR
jgi:hypothetical protein